MKKTFFLWVFLVVFSSTHSIAIAQEEQESAEVYLEEYTDEFQENFFEALKQKGIQNYDRAIDLLLKCKELEPNNSVVDYELGKAYLLDKKYVQAQEYAIEALLSEPTDFWYLDNLLTILEKQGSPIESVQQQIPYDNQKLKENMALSYFKKKKFEEALNVTKELKGSKLADDLILKINDSLQQDKEEVVAKTEPKDETNSNDPVSQLKSEIETLIANRDYIKLLEASKDAVDNYPLQPYFYLVYGKALNNTSNANKAIEVMESGLDYILDDAKLTNAFYEELSKAYSKLGNTQKANEYLNKINSGL
ncbi:lipopolysaccharide assembly protein LapB [Allomuricauda sp. NBRC 101325]|uniref:tetratricopeptide repeat protein n=1 Tax=Allomuricauda sp. NBRC 101325 TaxID=1113758 RepID=UPI0024A0A44A|nr:hypothetical protein [Muricauda sp. NBRC 101325]GLU43170.1 hypothetical protein Musp01_07940 [Muricauda sp. NBRC 101325]